MKISRTGSTSAAAPAGRVKKAAAASGAFAVEEAEVAKGTSAAQSASAVAGVDALLAMQEVDEEGTRKRRAVRRGHDMLDILDEIRIALLEGAVPVTKLKALLRVVNADTALTADPVINAVIAEVDLRARVELAKFGHYS